LTFLSSHWARRLTALAFILTLLSVLPASPPPVRAQANDQHKVTWDSHSLLIDGRRVFLFSGEFHYWRLPSPDQWQDRLLKMKAAGLNAVSIYFDWQYHSNAPGTYDFTGVRDVDRLLTMADRLGLYVLARVGPYMNGEADAGGLPGWLLSKPLFPRSQGWNGQLAQAQDSPLYEQYAKEWYDHIVPIVARHQITNGGSVLMLQVENEYSQDQGSQQYMQHLIDWAHADGITVPIFHNDYWFKGDWSKVVDLYAYDSYPYGFACCHQWYDEHFHGIDTWESALRSTLKIATPMFVSELQGGAFDPWGGVGYDQVAKTLDGDWLTALDESAMAQGTSVLNTYMFVGGTSWGYMSEPAVYTSYDYGAPIAESGALRPAYYAAHRLGMFLQSYGPELAGADAAPAAATTTNPQVVVHSRVGPSGQLFVFLRHGDAGAPVDTRLNLTVQGKLYSVPQRQGTAITVPGHGAALLTANVDVGPMHLNYSTSQVLTDSVTAQGHYLVLYGPSGTAGEADFVLPTSPTTVIHNAGVKVTRTNQELRLNYSHTSESRTVAITTTSGVLRILITSSQAASRFWQSGKILLSGPDLVSPDSSTDRVWLSKPREVRSYGAPATTTEMVNGESTATPDAVMGTTLLGTLLGASALVLPKLTSWKFSAEAPETAPNFDDSSWQLANHTSTTNPNVPLTSTLLMDDYGFHYGYVWYRGHFTATGAESGITLEARQSYSVYLNGVYLGSGDESLADPPHPYAAPHSFAFPPGVLRPAQDNVLSVLTESLGHDEGWLAGPVAQSPQGILSATMNDSPTPITWRIQGATGGEQPGDTERGLMNASGLFGERQGWYRPAFDDRFWSTITTPDNWQARDQAAPIGWYRTHFRLAVPSGIQAPMGLLIPHVSDTATIWLNGWLVGRYWEQKGPQHLFYLPSGILKPSGDNLLAIAVWNRGGVGGLTATPQLVQYPSLAQHTITNVSADQAQTPDYWHTAGNRIVDSAGHPVRIAAVNWFGMENQWFVPAGLDIQPLDAILTRIKDLGFNTIRLPFSNQLVEENPTVTDHLDANPTLRGLHALDLLDRIIDAAGQHRLRIILNDGRSEVGTQPETNGLWYTPAYPESAWIQDWRTLVTRYQGNATVIGVDLRNEPHTGPPGPWSVQSYLHQGATWGPYHGVESAATDWRLAAARGGNAVLSINPHLLIFVEGIQQYPNTAWPGGVESYWWGGILYPALRYPVRLSVSHQLVYSPHEYGPLKWQMPFFGPHMTYAGLAAIWDQHWGFLEHLASNRETPIFIGEFGTCGNTMACLQDQTAGSEGQWFGFLMRYLKQHPEISWGFWAVNGTNHLGNPTPGYILTKDWHALSLPGLVQTLRDIEYPPPPGN